MDRMDYLLRDSHYCGVKYGLFDLSRLLDTLTICESQKGVWQLGVDSDGVQAVEEFVFARYWMFIQVYFHKTRRIFDYFLVQFLKQYLENGTYPANLARYLEYNDNSILQVISNSDINWAQYLWKRDHLREVFVSVPHQHTFIDEENGFEEKSFRFNDYHKLGWMDEEFKKAFQPENEPGNYFIDQAKTASAKEHIEMRTVVEEASCEDEEGKVADKRLYAIPVKDKHSDNIKPIQEYSIPINKNNYLTILIFLLILLILLTFLLWAKNNTVFCRMSINLYGNNFPREMSLQSRLKTGEKIWVKEKRLPWLFVKTESMEGWLPEWYVIRNAKNIMADIVPYLMVVKEKTPLYLYPDYPVYRYYPNELETINTGVVVKVENEFNNWRYVRFIVHTIPAVQRGWIKSESLTTSQEVTPMQGKILVGTKVYIGDSFEEDITSLPTTICDLNMSVSIGREKGDMVYVFGAAGWSAWVNKKDIIFDPFFD